MFPLFSTLKNAFLGKNGVEIQNFEKSKKVPLDISEIHVSKFGTIRMKIMAGSLPEHYTHTDTRRTFQYPGTLLYQHASIHVTHLTPN